MLGRASVTIAHQEREYARIALEAHLHPNPDLAWHHSQRALDAIGEAERAYRSQLADALLPTRSSDADRQRLIQECVELAEVRRATGAPPRNPIRTGRPARRPPPQAAPGGACGAAQKAAALTARMSVQS